MAWPSSKHVAILHRELWMLMCLGPVLQQDLTSEYDGQLSCLDASESGGACAISNSLSWSGRSLVGALNDLRLRAVECPVLVVSFFPKQFTVKGSQFFLKMCPPLCDWWCLPLRSCLCLVCLAGLVCALSPFICLPSCVSLSGGVRLSGLVCALSPFMCLPEWWCPPLGLVCALSPFICLPSCVSLSGGVRLFGLVCALSPFICLPSCVSLSGGVRLSGLVCALSPFMCLPEWWCPPLQSCLCLVSLHLSP